MAKCARTSITQEVTKTETVPGYTLTLTQDEAETLMSIVGSVSGDSKDSPRKHADAVYYALQGQGLSAKYRKQVQGTMRLLKKPTPDLYTW